MPEHTPFDFFHLNSIDQLAGGSTLISARHTWSLYELNSETGQVPLRIGRECSRDTNASIAEHFERGTLVDGLPGVRLPALFVHGVLDPIPLSSIERTAALVPGARLETIADCGHFPWWERPGETRRLVGAFLAGQA